MLMKPESNSVVYLTWHTLMFWNALFFLCGIWFFHQLRSKCSAEPKWSKSFCHLHAHPEMKFRKWSNCGASSLREVLCRRFSFVALYLRKVYLCWPRRGLSFFKRKARQGLSVHRLSSRKKVRVEPTHGADASLFKWWWILATTSISHGIISPRVVCF